MSGRIISADIKKNGVSPEVEQTYGAFLKACPIRSTTKFSYPLF